MTVVECASWLNEHDNILLVTHKRPDGDTLGSAAALCSALKRSGKNAAMFNNPEITEKYLKYVSEYIEDNFEYEYVVSVDAAEKQMLCVGFDNNVDLSIDHHPSNPHYADNLLLKAGKASCGEIVLEVIEDLCGGLTPTEADLLYMAVSTDCGGFRYANVNSETFAAASKLASYGADIQKLNFDLFRQVSRARIVLEGMICAQLRFFADGKVVVAAVTRQMMNDAGATENDCDDLAGIPGRVEGCAVSLLIRELDDGRCKVSARSHPGFDCNALCSKFGGGGHKMASGCTVDLDVEKTIDALVSCVLEVL